VSLARETVHSSLALRIDIVRCRPEDGACSAIEYAPRHTLAFPLRGVFVLHHGRHDHTVADACQALVFDPKHPYRVSHPVDGGDDCFSIEPAAALLSEIALPSRPAPLEARVLAAPRLLWHRMRRGLTGPLEIEETALELLSSLSASQESSVTKRQAELVEATKLALAAQPAERWTLEALAKRAHSSPFHLARVFRRLAGLPLHRYHLRARLTAALAEVLDTRRELTDIGLGLGFSSHSHFTAAFRGVYGAAPSVLRKRARF
jgi:AraC-like DNA-binding protein